MLQAAGTLLRVVVEDGQGEASIVEAVPSDDSQLPQREVLKVVHGDQDVARHLADGLGASVKAEEVRNGRRCNHRSRGEEVEVCWCPHLEEGEIPVTLDLGDLQVPYNNLTAVVAIFDQVVLVLLGACGAQAILRAVTHH